MFLLSRFMMFFLGLLSIIESPFSWLVILAAVGGYLGISIYTRRPSNTSNGNSVKDLANSAWSLSLLMLWISLYFSSTQFENNSVYTLDIAGSGGFPLLAFGYPSGALGGDVPPLHMWPAFFLNWLLLALVSALVVFLLKEKVNFKKISRILMILAIITTVCGLGYVSLMFD